MSAPFRPLMILSTIIAITALSSACSTKSKGKDDKSEPPHVGSTDAEPSPSPSPQPPVDPNFPAVFYEHNGNSLSRIRCKAAGDVCDGASYEVILLTDLWPAIESHLELPKVKQDISKTEAAVKAVDKQLADNANEQSAADAAPTRISEIDQKLGQLNAVIADLETNLDAIAAAIAADPNQEALLSGQRSQDEAELTEKRAQHADLTSEKAPLVTLVSRESERQAERESLLNAESEHSALLSSLRKQEAEKSKTLAQTKARLNSLAEGGARHSEADFEDLPFLSASFKAAMLP